MGCVKEEINQVDKFKELSDGLIQEFDDPRELCSFLRVMWESMILAIPPHKKNMARQEIGKMIGVVDLLIEDVKGK